MTNKMSYFNDKQKKNAHFFFLNRSNKSQLLLVFEIFLTIVIIFFLYASKIICALFLPFEKKKLGMWITEIKVEEL